LTDKAGARLALPRARVPADFVLRCHPVRIRHCPRPRSNPGNFGVAAQSRFRVCGTVPGQCLRVSCRAAWPPSTARSSRDGSAARRRVRGDDLQVTENDAKSRWRVVVHRGEPARVVGLVELPSERTLPGGDGGDQVTARCRGRHVALDQSGRRVGGIEVQVLRILS